jgi:hypothetical protein
MSLVTGVSVDVLIRDIHGVELPKAVPEAIDTCLPRVRLPVSRRKTTIQNAGAGCIIRSRILDGLPCISLAQSNLYRK